MSLGSPALVWARRRRRRLLLALAGIAVAALALLASPLLGVPLDARAAKNHLIAASAALQDGDVTSARDNVESAREHLDVARGGLQRLGDGVWSWVPQTSVDDTGQLVQALDEATNIAEIGVDLYPEVAGERSTLFRDQQVDRAVLDRAIDDAYKIQDHLASADEALSEVQGTTPLVGALISAQRDAAAARVEPMVAAIADAEPLLAELPAMLGYEGTRDYLIAMLNPAELRYSGGAALSFVPMRWDQGKLDLGESLNTLDDPRLSALNRWRKVAGNVLHPQPGRVTTAAFAPSWSVSGEEMLRAWRSARNERYDGLVAVDVVAFSKLLGATGPVTVRTYGELNEGNLVETLVGSYNDYYPDATVQDSLNADVVPAFQDQLLRGGKFVAKAKALGAAAEGRHFALYFRDDEVQKAIASVGLEGDLTAPDGDYLGVFTQNLNASKTDFYQRRRVALDVALNEDGSSSNNLQLEMHNDTPSYEFGVDPQWGHFTRWAGVRLSAFLPRGVAVDRASFGGRPFDADVRHFYEHDMVWRSTLLEPGASAALELRYRVPRAAENDGSGDLVYRLAIDPQGTVNPQAVDVTVRVPGGYRATDLPAGWSSDKGVLTYSTDALESTQTWEIPIAAPPS
jgi:hypothetical protein